MDAGVVLGLSLTVYGIIIAAMFLVVLIALLLCCYNFGTHYRTSPKACDDFELATQPESKESTPPYLSYRPNVHVCHGIPVNRRRMLTPLPNSFHNFIIGIIIPSFEKQRLTGYQFAVVVLLSEEDIDNICGTRFIPSNGRKPTLNKYHPSMPRNAIHYGNYIVARPNGSWHSEEEIFGKYSSIDSLFSQLWTAYVKRYHSRPKCILLYSWNLPCSRCTDVIIRSLNDDTYRRTSAIVAYSTYWQKELGEQYTENEEKLKNENITVEEVQYPTFIPPA